MEVDEALGLWMNEWMNEWMGRVLGMIVFWTFSDGEELLEIIGKKQSQNFCRNLSISEEIA